MRRRSFALAFLLLVPVALDCGRPEDEIFDEPTFNAGSEQTQDAPSERRCRLINNVVITDELANAVLAKIDVKTRLLWRSVGAIDPETGRRVNLSATDALAACTAASMRLPTLKETRTEDDACPGTMGTRLWTQEIVTEGTPPDPVAFVPEHGLRLAAAGAETVPTICVRTDLPPEPGVAP